MKRKIKRFLNRTDFLLLKISIKILFLLKSHKFDYRIGLVSCDKFYRKKKEDLLIQFYLIKNNINAEIISWQNNNINYQKFDGLIIRSIWGIDECPTEFIDWLNKLDNNIAIFNDIDVLKKNFDKEIQFKILKDNRLQTIPTIFTNVKDFQKEINNMVKKNIEEFVVKPTFSESGHNTYRFKFDELKYVYKKISNLKSRIMIQPFIKEALDGEYNICCIGKNITHIVWRTSGVFNNKNIVRYIPKENIEKKLYEIADRVINLDEYCNNLYTRIDIIKQEEKYMIMEIEALDPNLFIDFIVNRKKQKEVLNLFAIELKKQLDKKINR